MTHRRDGADAMKKLIVVAFLGLLAAALSLCMIGNDAYVDDGQEVSNKWYSINLAEGVRVRRHGVYGVDFVKCDSCRIEKLRCGPLSFGGFNVLVLVNLEIVMPERDATSVAHETCTAKSDSVHELARDLGLTDGLLASQGIPLKFSGIKISGFRVSRLLGDGKSVRLAFAAGCAESAVGGLELYDCIVHFLDGKSERVGKAMLVKVDGVFRLKWDGGEMTL